MKQYGPEYWDKYGVYRTPIGFNLTLLVLLRAYLLWIFSAVARRPDLDFMSLFFQSKQHFFVSLAIGTIALVPTVIFSLRRPTSSQVLAKYWRYMRWPLLITAAADLIWLILQASQSYYQFSFYLAVQMVMLLWVILYLVKSRYLVCFFNDWPEPESKLKT
ncbi:MULTISPECIES: DUF2919 domain-containing protein [Pseudoalteromonas]|uniref:DUF2919 domain-containing protein n=1 Tax=Pseudoalteromonas aurantia 208 TaxID=1314867 RepID=A0ABR9EDD4_9GAMM|nr:MULTISPECIES: DUF2919 domain-containing protein [Pseudoalteromonas]MBE0368980.1 hypothetical protein [Pseudoalteromonas aurantia 208]MBQ4847547.1 DUF2919 domain-containing protein [Pseudoalteromonas sp. MMG005]MBQ4851510.1 DUF2919 domain-containing protein [Pseudoalteromonas sp. MMG012]